MVQITTVFQNNPRVERILNDNYCKKDPLVEIDLSVVCQNQSRQVTFSRTVKTCCNSCSFCHWYRAAAKESHTPCLTEIKHVESVSFVSHCLSVPPFLSVSGVVENPPVGGKLQRFWETWLSLGLNPQMASILQKGYNLPFKMRPALARSPLTVSRYANSLKNSYLKEALGSKGPYS